MNEESKSVPELSETGWNLDMVFLMDITSLLNELNTKLRGKLKLINEQVKERILVHLHSCKSVFETSGEKKFCMAKRKFFRNYPTALKLILIKIQRFSPLCQ
jgi:hypothetical protein